MFVTSMGRRSRLLLLFLPAHDCWSKPINKAHVVTELNQFKNKSRGSSFHLVWASRNCHKLTKKKKKLLVLCSCLPFLLVLQLPFSPLPFFSPNSHVKAVIALLGTILVRPKLIKPNHGVNDFLKAGTGALWCPRETHLSRCVTSGLYFKSS